MPIKISNAGGIRDGLLQHDWNGRSAQRKVHDASLLRTEHYQLRPHESLLIISIYNEAFEEVTLQKLSEYCHYHDDDDDHDGVNRRVVYMHNKGSYEHHEGLNDVWTRHLTTAICARHIKRLLRPRLGRLWHK
jgi:hypothetical protein